MSGRHNCAAGKRTVEVPLYLLGSHFKNSSIQDWKCKENMRHTRVRQTIVKIVSKTLSIISRQIIRLKIKNQFSSKFKSETFIIH